MFAGITLIGAYTGFVAFWFLKPIETQRDAEVAALRSEVERARNAEIALLRAEVTRLRAESP